MLYRKEVPYVCQVNVVRFIEHTPPRKIVIEVEIVVERESQKGILLGKVSSLRGFFLYFSRINDTNYEIREELQ